ncbi:CDGSH iron-sulfur domain-containing protein [Gracilibacillus salinarum]|uniref:CDGSH iron-sulfur domain-containing protein n=1 Tax=Gracilibacillus salinarum TaxID=2932255 RepID=A0ABY4GJ08_9BACI|nr:CDGSH iron-sulfur domain-containing protein [Gracilibacillus salinarum]UOQ84186.1 CDGSH iron-sulfur domain-containing protein [Gracilibacillus salinarum]
MCEEKANKVQLKVRDNGSILVTGDVELVDAEGNPFPTKQKFSLCRCGASKNKPFCDGSHKEIDFQDQIRAK